MSLESMEVAWRTKDISPVEKLALIYIAECAGMDVWVRDLAKLTAFAGCSFREAENALISLRGDRYILSRESRIGRGCGYYVVLPYEDDGPLTVRAPARVPGPIEVAVYVLGEAYPDSELVKVGISRHPEQRCATLQREKQRNLFIAHRTICYSRSEAFRIESLSHARLGNFALGGEWFSCGTKLAWDAIRECGGHPDVRFEDVL